MPSRLAAVLSRHDLPEPELCALILDGEGYRVDDCIAPLDEILSPRLRAAALAAVLPPRLIVELRSAAWVWGATLLPPDRHQVCADIHARSRPPASARLELREVIVDSSDLARLGDIRVTTPLRTAIDLARAGAQQSSIVPVLVALMRVGGFRAVDCAVVLEGRRNLPNKRVALERLWTADRQLENQEPVINGQPELTR